MTTSKERLLQTIALLEEQGIGEHDRAFDILNALASGLIWSEESQGKRKKNEAVICCENPSNN